VQTFTYYTGWRRSEVLALQWCNVDRQRQVINTAWVLHERLLKAETICPFVFQRNGKEIRDFRTVWESACETAGCPNKILHDFRRTAARNLIRAGVPERIAMGITGHKTRSVFARYNIVDDRDLRTALGALATSKPTTPPRKGQVQQFKQRKTG
jgi:integrase